MSDEVKRPPLLRIKFEGSAVHEGRILYDDLSTFVTNLSLAIDRILNSMLLGTSIKKGRPTKTAQLLSALEIAYVRKGSFHVALDLRRSEHQFPGWDMGEQAIDVFMLGLRAVQRGEPLPEQYDMGVMMALRDAGTIIERGIDRVSINSTSGLGNRRVLYTLPLRNGIKARLRKLERGYQEVEGRLVMLDIEEGKWVCRLRPSMGDPILCKFDEDLTEEIMKNARRFVRVAGEGTQDPITGKVTSLRVRDIEPIDEASSNGGVKEPASSFWATKDFDELATVQGVYPVDDLAKLSADWPEDTDFDSFLDAVRSVRD